MEANNIDSILIPREQAIQAKETIPSAPYVQPEVIERPVESPTEVKEQTSETVSETQETAKQQTEETTNSGETGNKSGTESSDSPIDEYGNPIEKPKMYSEDEVQRMIRDRLSRGRHAEQQPTQQQIQKDVENFQADPDSDESWQQQLDRAIDQRIETRQRQLSEKQWQQQENARQAEFEAKFTAGMNKYQDFHSVVAGKAITDSMMIASRALDNPAAFIYGAAKLHPQELARISQIGDPYAQAAEVGRLHERMVKERKLASNAPRPLETPKSDISNKVVPTQPSIDQRIESYGQQKQKRK